MVWKETNLGAIPGKLLWREPCLHRIKERSSTVAVVPGDEAVTLSKAASPVADSGGDLKSSVSLAEGKGVRSLTTARLPSGLDGIRSSMSLIVMRWSSREYISKRKPSRADDRVIGKSGQSVMILKVLLSVSLPHTES